ncbi:MAG: thiamine biosynthesis protein ThiS [endosymbiont of Galathealinum brachiosum]|uniref:Thiamine biosynthesis protein ThiS n=1 Tax=endosymbiont of Galathealinum brachiosum TaxID=2200906 RepID=A0A370DCH9_9GAMM|nr:MAG: thiamine biosynthesis protein ThiS [endosymbiont of Galathealinum brachiosum]
MKIQLNGKELQIDSGTTLIQLINNEGMTGKRLAAEVNREIITKAEHPNHILKDGDIVEIVHAIGGG